MYCVYCAAMNADESRFCRGCGKPLDISEPAPEPGGGPPVVASTPPGVPAYASVAPAQAHGIANQGWGGAPGQGVPMQAAPGFAGPPGAHNYGGINVTVQQTAPAYMVAPKSTAVAFLLTLFFGPLGLFYSSPMGGLVLCVVSIPVNG